MIVNNDNMKFMTGLASDYIFIESARKDEYVKYINENIIEAIYICDLEYFDNNIDFLKECKHIKKVNLGCYYLKDYSGLKHLIDLRVLIFTDINGKIDLTENKLIEELRIEWSKNIIGLDKLIYLKKLHLMGYKPNDKNLTELTCFKEIEELSLVQGNINSLKGCRYFKNLKRLELSYLRNLEYIDEIEENAATLKTLRIDNCKKIKNYDYAEKLKELETLAYCCDGDIPNIKFIENMPKLKDFIFVGSNVVDGDLSYCERLEYVGYIQKRHYSHKQKELNTEIK